MDFVVQPRVVQWLVENSPYFKKYFIFAKLEGLDGTARYLHKDGAWHTTTFTKEEAPAGYFDTKEEAEAILATTKTPTMVA